MKLNLFESLYILRRQNIMIDKTLEIHINHKYVYNNSLNNVYIYEKKVSERIVKVL